MSDPENPFARKPEQALKPPTRTTVVSVSVAVVAVLVALFFVMLWAHAKTDRQQTLDALAKKLSSLTDDLAKSQSENQTNQDLIANLKTQIGDLQKEKEMAGQMAHNLESEMRTALESRDVTISNLQGRLTVTIVDRVMFDSGEAVLKPGGAAVMQKIAALLAEHPKLKIHVIGHTDNVPIRSSARFASNWELSAARALAAVHYLVEKAGVDPRRVGAVGYGEFRPIADNATAEGRAKNRRIAITILPEDFNPTDTPPAAEVAPVPPNGVAPAVAPAAQ